MVKFEESRQQERASQQRVRGGGGKGVDFMCLLPSFLIHFTAIWEFGRFPAINYGKLIEIALDAPCSIQLSTSKIFGNQCGGGKSGETSVNEKRNFTMLKSDLR